MSTYLAALGAPNTKQNRSFLSSWQRWEGGHTANSAKFNYMNTTQRMPGSSGINSVGVQRYKNLQQGAQAFAQTLRNGRYGDIVGALRAGNPYGRNITAGLSTWLSGSPNSPSGAKYASKVLGTRVAAPPPSGAPATVPGARPGLQPPRVRKLTAQPKGPDLQAALQMAAPTAASQDILSRLGGMAGRIAERNATMPIPLPAQAEAPIAPIPGVRAPGALRQRVAGQKFMPTASGFAGVVPNKFRTSVGGLHPTAGLPGYEARDVFAKPGSPVTSPVNGKVIRLSGHDPKKGPTQGPHGPLGWSTYIQAKDGSIYYLTHQGSRNVKPGQTVKRGQVIGTVANYDKYGTPSHVHVGVHHGG
jgi:murein DD-endopeptidase MepM/ murein hydrolase activator NlpD